ncbi:MAG: ROK family protein [Kiritimatiellae bacterium]|nr:ROK family protein [Kiritimatiellia bacterium]
MNQRTQLKIAELKVPPVLDPGFTPPVLWHRAYQSLCDANAASRELVIALGRPDSTVFTHCMQVLPAAEENRALNFKAVERVIQFLLWQKGGSVIYIAGAPEIGTAVAEAYSKTGARAFTNDMMSRFFLAPLEVKICEKEEIPEANESALPLGRHLEGCRIGFDLGGSDRKCAAVVDGQVIFSEEVVWDPYFESDPEYHFKGICDSLKLAAAHLPRVDAIGGSAAGIYVDNEPRVASLFRGVPLELFESQVRPIFKRVMEQWKDIPFVVINDGEVTALAGAMSLDDSPVLGIAMGTSQAGGYCAPNGGITPWLNELAFAPVDYRADAPVDEWSGDGGCGVQYFSQQAVARLIPAAGINLPEEEMSFPEQLEFVQELMENNDQRAAKIYETLGVYFGYSLAWYAEFYEIKHMLLLGRVTSGPGGDLMISVANDVLTKEFPQLREQITISMPDEKLKRHGQAIAAASLPVIG